MTGYLNSPTDLNTIMFDSLILMSLVFYIS